MVRKCAKERNGYNSVGMFLSRYLQNIENNLLMSMYNCLKSRGFVVGVLAFDGCMIEKCEALNDEVCLFSRRGLLRIKGIKSN